MQSPFRSSRRKTRRRAHAFEPVAPWRRAAAAQARLTPRAIDHTHMKETTMKTSAPRLLALAALVAGCATAEYRQEASICTARWLRVIPPHYETRLIQDTRPVRRPTGRIDCVTHRNHTVCEQKYMTVFVPYQT
jgi:hypothetical protein